MYERDGERYFIVDGHVHYWNAAPDNWIEGQEVYAKGFIDCFYAYHGLGPAEAHWPYEQFQQVDPELMMRHLFEEGHVDVAIFQPTYLTQWYKEGFNTTERCATLAEQHPERFVLNGAFDPRAGDAGVEELEANVERYSLRGVKLYTAEWRGESRGWSLKSDEAARYLQVCERLGVRNIHVHKGPTIWPLDKDAFDVADVDFAATNFPNLNFVVEHVGLPRIEDFCFMATQEPNVYAGLAVVIPLIHTRPRMFAKVMGELMFWLGEDRLVFGSDYAIWEPKWQIEGFTAWNMPDGEEFSDYAPLTNRAKKKILGLNAARLYDVDVPADLRIAEGEPGVLAPLMTDNSRVWAALDTVRDPELDTSIVELGFVTSCTLDADGTARVRLRLPTFFCAPNFAFLMVADAHEAVSGVAGVTRADIVLEDHFASGEINAGVAAKAGFVAAFDGLAEHELDELRRDFLRKAMLAAQERTVRPLLTAGHTMEALGRMRLGDLPDSSAHRRLRARRAELGIASGDDDPLLVTADGDRVPCDEVPVHLRRARTIRVSIEANADYCRQLLTERYRDSTGVAPRAASSHSS